MSLQNNDKSSSLSNNGKSIFWRYLILSLTVIGILLVLNQVFYFGPFKYIMIFENSYLYLLLAIFCALTFLLVPISKDDSTRKYFGLDCILAVAAFALFVFVSLHGHEIYVKGWGYHAPPHMTIISFILWAIILEAVRRSSGNIMLAIVFVASIYPMFAEYMPGILMGPGQSASTTAVFHLLSFDSVLGIPIKVFANILVGFILFGVVLQAVGGGKWFLELAYSMLGQRRGGPGKVAVLSCALFGTISGSPMSNVVTSGSITIPAMIETGFSPTKAAAFTTCAATGGVLMPPIMGAVAFIMASHLGISYADVALAAVIPSLLYYMSLFFQIDNYVLKHNLVESGTDEIPTPIISTLKQGWAYILSFAVLIYVLFSLRLVSQAPFYATAVLLALSAIQGKLELKDVPSLIISTAKNLSTMVALLAGIGMVMGSITMTGIAATLSRELVLLAGGNTAVILILGALASFILGMGLTTTACYILVGVVLAPALVQQGFNEIAVHMFLLYWGVLSYITPPVALAAFPAASIANEQPLKVAFEAALTGGVIYLVPFIFVYEPALVAQAGIASILLAFLFASIGVFIMSAAFSGYMIGLGNLDSGITKGALQRIALVVSGFLIALPSSKIKVYGVVIFLVTIAIVIFKKTRLKR